MRRLQNGRLKNSSKRNKERGVTMLLVVAILSSLLSISMGIFNVIFGQMRISGEIADSFVAFYSADQGIERTLYIDRISDIANPYGICPAPGANCYVETGASTVSGGCYDLSVNKAGGATEIKVLGQYRCGANPTRVVKRGFNLVY